jgi:phthalate 4,5-dioxygenase oxygenase subunit
MARHRLMRATKALSEKGVLPPGRVVEHQGVRSAAVILTPEQRFDEAGKEALRVREGVSQASV